MTMCKLWHMSQSDGVLLRLRGTGPWLVFTIGQTGQTGQLWYHTKMVEMIVCCMLRSNGVVMNGFLMMTVFKHGAWILADCSRLVVT